MLWILDYETKSELDIKKVGAGKYGEDASALMLGYMGINEDYSIAVGAGVVDFTKGEKADFIDWRNDKFIAHNASFDRMVTEKCLGIKTRIDQWLCSAVWSASVGLPRNLSGACAAVGAELKDDEGKRLIRKFSMPQPKNRKVRWFEPEGEDWDLFVEYCRQDIVATHSLLQFLKRYPMSDKEWQAYWLDQKINDAGVPVDSPFINKAIVETEKHTARVLAEMKQVTGLANPNSVVQLREWLGANGCDVPNLQAATVDKAVTKHEGTVAGDVLKMKQALGGSAVKKYSTIQRAICSDGTLKGAHLFYGARTGRFSSQLVNSQNMARPTMDVEKAKALIMDGAVDADVLKSGVRGAITAPEGRQFVICDLSGIENRVLPWLCNDEDGLDRIRRGIDNYKVAASSIFHVDYSAVDSEQRQIGKIAVLACGYQGGHRAFTGMAANYGITDMTEAVAQEAVEGWRRANPRIVKFWYECEQAFAQAVMHPGVEQEVESVKFVSNDEYLVIVLPSGRLLYYYAPEISGDELKFSSVNTYTRKFERMTTYGGDIVQSITQATARDVLVDWMLRLDGEGFDLRGHVHDEVWVVAPYRRNRWALREIEKAITRGVDWAPSLPIGAEGFISKVYRK